MKTIEDYFSEHNEGVVSITKEHESALFQDFNLFSVIASDCFYILDISKNKFRYIKPDDFFLCGYSVEEAMNLGCDFYSRVIYPEDLHLWTNILKILIRYLKNFEGKLEGINYFSCTFRLLRQCSFLTIPLPQMIYQRMKPVWMDNELRYLICTIRSSTNRKTGNLCLQTKERLEYKEYDFTANRWRQYTREPLTEREKAILMLASQGRTTVEIADNLCKGEYTIRNQIKTLFSKLKVHSMQEAIESVNYHCMLY